MKLSEYIHYDAIGLADLVRKKEIEAEELLNTALIFAEKINPIINAIVISFPEKAYEQIREGIPAGIFSGVPSLLKNLAAPYKGTLETQGSHYFRDNICNYTSLGVCRLLEAGLIFFGRTNSPEFGLSYSTEPSLYGPTHNPWDLTRTAGGSSGGSAAAVASRIVPMALASDGGGSIRIPAACCGIFGLKPSRGRIPSGPESAESWSGLAIKNVLTRSVRDSAAALDILSAPALGSYYPLLNPEKEPYLSGYAQPPKKLIIGLLQGPFHAVPVAPDCQKAVEQAIHLFRHLGHEVEPVHVNLDLDNLDNAVYKIIAAHVEQALEYHQKLRGGRAPTKNELEPITQHFANISQQVRGSDMISSKNIIFQQSKKIAKLMTKFDILLTPALAKPPVLLGEINSHDEFNHFTQKNIEFTPFMSLFNQTGQPAMTIPVYWTESGLPISIQCAAAVGNELTLFQLAHQIEQIQPWIRHYPDLINAVIEGN